MKDVMLDLETLSTSKDACIVQIGACYFDRNTGEIGQTLKINVDPKSAVKAGAKIDADTVMWWLSQDKAAQNSILDQPRLSIEDAMNQLNEFLKDASCIWSHATFDYVIISEVFKQLSIKTKFRYTAARDIRTLVDLAKITLDKTKREGVAHDALHDCLHQVKYCVEAFRVLSGARNADNILTKVKKLL